MHDSDHCISCGRACDLPGQHFCPTCGQPTPVHRIDWHFLGHEFEHSVLHMDRGLLYTLKSMVLRPGHFIRDYIEGRRAGHVKPLFLLMLTAATLVFLSNVMLGGDILGASTDTARLADGIAGTLMAWANHHYAAATLILLPLEAAGLKLAFKRFRTLNYPEWLVITAFLTAQAFVIHAVFILLDRWVPGRQTWTAVLGVGWNTFTLTQYFAGYPRWKSALRALWGFMLYEIVASVLLAIVFVVIMTVRHGHA